MTGTSNDTRTGANEGVERVDSENGVEEDNAVIDTHSNFGELPEVEPRFMQMEGEVIFGEQDTADIVNISLESPSSVDQHSLVREISDGHIEAPPDDESPHFDFMEFEANGDILDEDLPENNHHGEAVEEKRYFSSKTVIEGTQLTHLEATLLYILEEIQSKNVKIVSVNHCTVARALKRDISKLIKNIIIKAKRDFKNQKPILAQSLRADDQRKTRMEETMATILLIDSAAPEAVRRTVRRGISTRRPATDGRPAIPGPDVGMIASQVSGDGQDNYQEQRRRNQEQGAELHEVSLGRMQNTRVNNNVRLGTQLNNFSTALETLSQTRQQSSSTFGSLLPELVARRDERARSRSRERAERRTMDLLLLSAITKKEEVASSFNVRRNLTVFKRPVPNLNISSDFPITLKLTNIKKLTKDLSEYMEVHRSVVHGIV